MYWLFKIPNDTFTLLITSASKFMSMICRHFSKTTPFRNWPCSKIRKTLSLKLPRGQNIMTVLNKKAQNCNVPLKSTGNRKVVSNDSNYRALGNFLVVLQSRYSQNCYPFRSCLSSDMWECRRLWSWHGSDGCKAAVTDYIHDTYLSGANYGNERKSSNTTIGKARSKRAVY